MKSIRDDLKAYLDGELSAARANEVEAALAQDDELRREAEAYRQISGSVKTLAFSPEPMGLERTLGALSSASGAGSGAKRRYPWVLALGAGLAVILGVQLFFPVFAQSKEAAKASSELMMAGRERSDQQAAQSPHYFGADDPGKGVKLMDTKEAGAKPRRKIDTGPSDELGSQAPASGLSRGGAPDYSGKVETQPLTREAAPKAVAAEGGGMAGMGRGAPEPTAQQADMAAVAAPLAKTAKPGTEATNRSAKAAAVGSSNFGAAAPARLVITRADLALIVKDVPAARDEADRIARQVGGFTERGDLQTGKEGASLASLRLRVPTDRYENVMTRVKKLGEVVHESSSGEDVTTRVADTEARSKTLKAEEIQYRALLQRANRISDVIEVRDKISEVRQQIESLDATAKSLRGLSELATIELSLSTKAPEPHKTPAAGWFQQTWGDASGSFVSACQSLASIGIYVLTFLPIWGPLALLCWWGWRTSRPVYRY